MKIKIFVEGGGSSKQLRVECRKAFSEFFRHAGVSNNSLNIVPSGSRSQAFYNFRTSIDSDPRDEIRPTLLIDSESPLTNPSKWGHLQEQDGWTKPNDAQEDHLFLMVQCMESWFMADREALKKFYKHNRSDKNLPDDKQIEQHSKERVFQTLEGMSRESSKGSYSKGEHSFKILQTIDSEKVCRASKHAADLVLELKKTLP